MWEIWWSTDHSSLTGNAYQVGIQQSDDTWLYPNTLHMSSLGRVMSWHHENHIVIPRTTSDIFWNMQYIARPDQCHPQVWFISRHGCASNHFRIEKEMTSKGIEWVHRQPSSQRIGYPGFLRGCLTSDRLRIPNATPHSEGPPSLVWYGTT